MTAWEWPDAVMAAVEALSGSVGAPVVTRVPDPRPVEFVRVQRVGGVRSQVLDTARLLLECWGSDEQSSWLLAADVREVLRTTRGDEVRFVREVGGPALLADPLTGAPRYLLTVEMVLHPTVSTS